MTEEEFISQHPLTKRLKVLGVSDEQLAVVRIVADLEHPYPSDWPVLTGLGCIRINLNEVPRALVQAYGLLKWWVLENPPDSLLTSAAVDTISEITGPLRRQSKVAQRPRQRDAPHMDIVISKMRTARQQGQSFDEFLHSAAADSIEDIKIEALGADRGHRWRITCHDLEAEKPPVARSTLEGWWTKAAEPAT